MERCRLGQGTVGAVCAIELTVLADGGANGTASVGIVFGDDRQGNASSFVLRNDHTWQIITYRNNAVEPKYTTNAVPDQHITQA